MQLNTPPLPTASSPVLKRKAVVALWWTSKNIEGHGRTWNMSLAVFPLGNVWASLEGGRLMWLLQPQPLLSRDTLSDSDRWLFQAWSQTVRSYQHWCTLRFPPPQAQQMYLTLKLEGVSMKYNNQNAPPYGWRQNQITQYCWLNVSSCNVTIFKGHSLTLSEDKWSISFGLCIIMFDKYSWLYESWMYDYDVEKNSCKPHYWLTCPLIDWLFVL